MNRIVAAILRGEPSDLQELLPYLQKEHLEPLVFSKLALLKKQGGSGEVAPDVTRVLEREYRNQMAYKILLEDELQKVFTGLAAQQIEPLLMKGTPLSYTHYAQPALRPLGDTDVFIAEKDRSKFDAVLRKLGYEIFNSVSGELISYQSLYRKQNPHGISFAIDCHWKISNPQRFIHLFTYEEVRSRAMRLEPLNAFRLSDTDALLLACVHRVAHHHDSDRLLWLYDLYLLQAAMSAPEFEKFVQLARQKQVLRICVSGLQKVAEFFGPLSHALPADLPDEPTAKYLDSSLDRWSLVKENLGPLPFSQKLRFLSEMLFPPSQYMMKKYAVRNRLLLPVLYLYRMAAGARKMFHHRL